MFDDAMICLACQMQMAHRRGLCDWCHRRTLRAVSAGKTTWAELERQGRVLPAGEGDYDTDENEEPRLAADLVGWFVIFGLGLFFAGVGLLLWATMRGSYWESRGPYWQAGVLIFSLGVFAMLVALKLAVAHCLSRTRKRE